MGGARRPRVDDDRARQEVVEGAVVTADDDEEEAETEEQEAQRERDDPDDRGPGPRAPPSTRSARRPRIDMPDVRPATAREYAE